MAFHHVVTLAQVRDGEPVSAAWPFCLNLCEHMSTENNVVCSAM
jgi:hypothetical protein